MLNRQPTAHGASRLEVAKRQMMHRGPDDWGAFTLGPGGGQCGRQMPDAGEAHSILLLHLRLSIIDLSEGGWQPMTSADGKHVLVFNGEIYNYLDLRRELEAHGHTFRSRSDSEVLLVALRHWGRDALTRLNGMFAFAYVDLASQTALLARDPFGIKPLYWAPTDQGIAFASELPGLLALTESARSVVPERLYSYLRFGVTDHGDGTLLQEAFQLPAGTAMEIDLRPWRCHDATPYWTAKRTRKAPRPSLEDAAEEVRALFLENVRLHLQSDVPLGTALSGGIDSTAIMCGMRRILGRDADIHAFGFVPSQREFSEEQWISLAAKHVGARLHIVTPSASELTADLPALIQLQGEPVGSPSIYAQRRVFRAAAEAGIKVMLDGQGADELLGGYRHYTASRIAGCLKRGEWRSGMRLLRAAARLPGTGLRAMSMMVGDVLVPSVWQAPLRAIAGRSLMPTWMDAGWFLARGVRGASMKPSESDEPFWEEMMRAMTVTILPHLLRYEDRNSMGASIESRVPFLTTPMLETLWSLPEEYLVDEQGVSKAVFRRAMRGIVPDAILDRKDKIGFVTPTAQWMTAESRWVEDVLRFACTNPVGGIDGTEARRCWNLVRAGHSGHAAQLWRCICYIEWARAFDVGGGVI